MVSAVEWRDQSASRAKSLFIEFTNRPRMTLLPSPFYSQPTTPHNGDVFMRSLDINYIFVLPPAFSCFRQQIDSRPRAVLLRGAVGRIIASLLVFQNPDRTQGFVLR